MSFLMERYLSTYGDNIPSPEDQTQIHGDNNTITDNNDGSSMPNTSTTTITNQQQSCGDDNMKHLPPRLRRSRRGMNPTSNSNTSGSKNSVQCIPGGDDLIVVDDDDLVGGDLTQVPDNQVSKCATKMLSNSNTDNCDDDGGDDKDKESESGTYTLDKEDPEVEEARRRIDQVFGVSCKDYSLPQSSSCDRVTLNSHGGGPIRTAISSSKTDGELSVKDSFFTRSRLAGALNKHQQQPSSTGVGGLAVNQNFVRARRSNMSLQGSNAGSDSDSNSNSPGTLTSHPVYASGNSSAANHNQINSNSTALNRVSPLHQKLNQRHSSSPHRRGSADLGGSRSASRERSTGLSSHNHHGQNYSRSYVGSSLRCGSEKGSRNSLNDFEDDSSLKSDPASSESTGSNCGGVGGGSGSRSNSEANHSSLPSMRLNRTVALRRAKLGMDTLGVPLNLSPKPAAPSISSTNSNQPVSRSGTSSRPTTSPTSFVRNDGGRFSLRVSSTSSGKKPPLAQDNHSAGAKNSSANSVNRLRNPSKTRAGGNSADEVSNRCRSPARSSSGVSSSSKVRHALQKSSSFTDPKDSNNSSSLHYYGNSDSHHESKNGSNSSYREMSPFQLGKRIFSNKPHQMLNRDNAMKTLSSHHPSSHYNQLDERTRAAAERLHESIRSSLCDDDGRNSKGLSPLDNLVIAATLQLSHKLRYNLRFILEDERLKFPADSETRIMIEELLPQVGVPDRSATCSSSKSKDLSNILKNLKKIEQSFELVSLLLKNRNLDISPSSPSEDTSFSDQVNGYQDEY